MSYFHFHADQHRPPRVPRRHFVFLGMLAPLAGRSQSQHKADSPPPANSAQKPRPAPSRPARHVRIFDAHLHCPSDAGEVWQWHPVTRTFEQFVAYLDRTGVQRGIINSVRSQMAKDVAGFVEGNREVVRRVEQYKGRFLGACVVNPLFIDEALREMEDCRKKYGMVWVGELCNYTVPYQYTIKEFELLVEQAVKLDMVLDVHTNLREMEYIIEKFPQATIVFPHFGGEQETIFRRIDLIAKHPNCYADIAGSGHERVGILEYAAQTIGVERVLFGSDFSINDPGEVIARVENSFLAPEQKKAVLSGNLENLLRRFSARA
jgi:predicted TIM-barrel fold metal-dependent hydrolase